jgi:4-hydroxyacetophenone monooxygenase
MLRTLPIACGDSAIRSATPDAHYPSLAAAVVHLTGDASLIRGAIKPAYAFFGDGQGGLSDQQKAKIGDAALEALGALRDGRLAAPQPPSPALVRETMNFVAGAEIPENYVPFLREELALYGEDRFTDKGEDIPQSVKRSFHVLIIGAGMSGILAAIRLGQAGIPYTIVDKNADVGGTWFENTYPGCRVDNPNHMYCYSFEPNHDWPHHYSTQDALLAYFRGVADKYGVRAKVRFNTEIVGLSYDERRQVWIAQARGRDGREESIETNAVITAVGQLNRPKIPDIKGAESFKGAAFHSARWDHSVDVRGKRVLVIGTGASAFQFVPAIAADVGEMFVFQRTPPWLGATPNYHDAVPDGQKWLLKHMPYYAQWYRFWLFWMLTDGLLPFVSADPDWNGPPGAVGVANQQLRDMLVEYARAQTDGDDDLLRKAVPAYPFGGKRAVRDNGVWLGAFKRPNVHLIDDPIVEITPDGVRTANGTHYAGDVLIYGTGFHASQFLAPMAITGRGGRDLNAQWAGDARAQSLHDVWAQHQHRRQWQHHLLFRMRVPLHPGLHRDAAPRRPCRDGAPARRARCLQPRCRCPEPEDGMGRAASVELVQERERPGFAELAFCARRLLERDAGTQSRRFRIHCGEDGDGGGGITRNAARQPRRAQVMAGGPKFSFGHGPVRASTCP